MNHFRLILVVLSIFLAFSSVQARVPTPGFRNYKGLSKKLDLKPGTLVWAPLPASRNDIRLCKFVRNEGSYPVVKPMMGGMDWRVPSPFVVRCVSAKGLKKGTPVMVNALQGTNSQYGFVKSLSNGRVTVEYKFGARFFTEELTPNQVIPMRGKHEFANPIAYKEGKTWKFATFLSKEGKYSWILQSGLIPWDTQNRVI